MDFDIHDRTPETKAGIPSSDAQDVYDAMMRTFEEFKDAAERAFLLNKLREFDWNVSETARAVEMPRSNLYKKIERYSLSREHS